jgi:protein-S-isoprenylcysteine O-methyltransferase Ste14
VIDHIRYSLGAPIVIMLPLGLLYWFIIHLGVRWWRKWGPSRTYLTVVPGLAAVGVFLFQAREHLLGADLGTNWSLIGIGLVLCFPMAWLELRYWKQLSISTLVGIPELSKESQGELLRDGIYGVLRHPRFTSAGIGLIVNALIANYLGLYILVMLAIPLEFLMLALEERELIDRFGNTYREYQREVPRLIPRLRRRI